MTEEYYAGDRVAEGGSSNYWTIAQVKDGIAYMIRRGEYKQVNVNVLKNKYRKVNTSRDTPRRDTGRTQYY